MVRQYIDKTTLARNFSSYRPEFGQLGIEVWLEMRGPSRVQSQMKNFVLYNYYLNQSRVLKKKDIKHVVLDFDYIGKKHNERHKHFNDYKEFKLERVGLDIPVEWLYIYPCKQYKELTDLFPCHENLDNYIDDDTVEVADGVYFFYSRDIIDYDFVKDINQKDFSYLKAVYIRERSNGVYIDFNDFSYQLLLKDRSINQELTKLVDLLNSTEVQNE